MGVKRVVDTSFWTDGKVDEFSPEDKYFMLYLLTNPFCKQLGIYEISIKQAAFQMGYSVEAVKVLLDRFENKYKMIKFSPETNEVAIINFLRHSVMKGGKPVEDCIMQDIAKVKNRCLIDFVFGKLQQYEDLNATVRKVVDAYLIENDNDIHNDNDNDNDRTVDVSPPVRATNRQRFVPPTVEEVRAYCCERGNAVDPNSFVDFYASKGWMVGRTKMKDWKAAVRTWERNEYSNKPAAKGTGFQTSNPFLEMLEEETR